MLEKVSDISQWSERMRAPMEAIYGVEGFPKLWTEFNQGGYSIGPFDPESGSKIGPETSPKCHLKRIQE